LNDRERKTLERQWAWFDSGGRRNVTHHFNLAASTTSAYDQAVWRGSQAMWTWLALMCELQTTTVLLIRPFEDVRLTVPAPVAREKACTSAFSLIVQIQVRQGLCYCSCRSGTRLHSSCSHNQVTIAISQKELVLFDNMMLSL